jgi:sugar (pentulose or hexulose) kinase
MTSTVVAGLDLGSTGIKVLVTDEQGRELFVEQLPTPWRAGFGGTTEMDPDALIDTVRRLCARVSELLESPGEDARRIGAIAISGMGESGVLVDAAGVAVAPAIAWFDPRGGVQVKALPDNLRESFAGRTGLPVGVQVSIVKMLALRDDGLPLHGLRWFNLPEYVAFALGGAAVSEYSLASRTGLLDQDTSTPWLEMLDHLGVPSDFLPPLVDAGTDLGTATADWLSDSIAGARLTVAGHDHLVSAVSSGSTTSDRYHASLGTAEVLLRVLDAPLSAAARARLADHLINCVRHVVPGKHVLVAGVKTGLLLRRALQLSGISERTARDRLDREVLALPVEGALLPGTIEVTGARNDDGVLHLTIRGDDISPAELFGAVLRHGNDELQLLLDAMNREVPPASSTLLTGGWAGMGSVQRARSLVLPDVSVSDRTQDTAYGAALFAARLLDSAPATLAASA